MASSAPPSNPLGGQVIGRRYVLQRRIGQGGMAEVWAAFDRLTQTRVAIKLLKHSLALDEVVAERFRREAAAVASLSHPNIVAVLDVADFHGRQAVVMELVEGKSLRQLLDSQRILGPELTIHIGACVAGALHAAHAANFVHRDVKPGNILVTPTGDVLLTDFGIAKNSSQDDLTSPNIMMGTAKYLAPEQVQGKTLDGRADLYALALVLYECLAGQVPFLGESDTDTALSRLQRDPTDLTSLRPTLPVGLVNLVHRTLSREPRYRPHSGEELKRALISCAAAKAVVDPTPAEPPRQRTDPLDDNFGRVVRSPRRQHPEPSASPNADQPPSQPQLSDVNNPAEQAKQQRQSRSRPAAPQHGQPARPPATGLRMVGEPELTVPDDTPPFTRRERKRRDASVAAQTPPHTPADRIGENRDGGHQLAHAPSRHVARLATAVLVCCAVIALWALVSSLRDTDTQTNAGAPTPPGASHAGSSARDPLIAAINAWDPFGTNGMENDAFAQQAADGKANTAWATECYQDASMGTKPGVGLIVSFNDNASGTLEIDLPYAPHTVSVLRAPGRVAPTSFDEWIPVGDARSGAEPGTLSVKLDEPTQLLLVWLTELAEDSACNSINPFRGKIAEIRVT